MKIRNLTFRAGFAFATAIALIATGSATAFAAIDSTYDTPEVREFYAAYGVDEATQDRLITSMQEGRLIDAMTAGAEPVSTREIERDGFIEFIYVYEDGSVAVTSLQNPEPEPLDTIRPFQVADCTVTSGSGFITGSNCLVEHTAAYASLSFRASYTRTAYYTGCKIWGLKDEKVDATIGSVSDKSLQLIRGTATSNQPAVATLHAHLAGGSFSEDLYLSLRVEPGRAWSTTY